MEQEENKREELKKPLNKSEEKRINQYAWVAGLILVALIIGLLFYKQRTSVDVPRDVVIEKDMTADWQTYKSDKYGFSFKYPKDWEVVPEETINSTILAIQKKDGNKNMIKVGISDRRSVSLDEPEYAIQISIPFDKRNYIVFSTSTENTDKKVFYNIPVTLLIGK